MTLPGTQVCISAVIPAAGQSRRMGRTKQTLRLGDSTMTATVVAAILEAGVDDVVVVTRSELVDQLELPRDERVAVAINDAAETEMIDSIRLGLAACSRSAATPNGILVVPGDMPKLRSQSLRMCIDAFASDPTRIVIATHRDRRGHPMIFPFSLRSTVDTLSGGLRSLAQQHPELVHQVAVDDSGAIMDVDTPNDLESL